MAQRLWRCAMHNLDLHPFTQAAVRELLFGLGFGALALASHAPESPAFDLLVLGGLGLIVGGSCLGISGGQTQPLLGGAR